MAAIEEENHLTQSSAPTKRPKRRIIRAAQRRAGHDLVWNVLTVLVWLGMASAIMAFLSIYANPQSLPAPFRPAPLTPVLPTLISAVQIPTNTATPVPSFTPEPGKPTQTLTSTPTPITPTVTFTPSPTITETVTLGPSPTATIHSLYPFILRGDIKVISGTTFPDHDACKLWVAGQAYDLQGAPMQGVTVMLGGTLAGKTLYQLSLTGTALQYGQAGYEFTIADLAVKSKQTAWVALFDQAMIPLSGKIYFDSFDDCSQNLILINFRQVR
jgi:hypothetical protein